MPNKQQERHCAHTTARHQTPAGPLCFLLAALTLVIACPPARALAEEQGAAAAEAHFNIAPQPLTDALALFGRQSGMQVSAAAGLIRDITSPGVSGALQHTEALSQLLAGTGIAYRLTAANTAVLESAPEEEEPIPMAPLTVEGEAQSAEPWLSGDAEKAYRVEDANVGVLGNKLLQDTPYSVEAYSSDLIKNKQARSLADITKGDASVNLTPDTLAGENNNIGIRGINLDNETSRKIDGLNARVGINDLPLEHVERVEILKGAGGFLYGFGQPGGIINYVLKRPTDAPFRSLNMQVMDSGLALIHGDVGGRFGADDRFGYRVNLVHESGDTYINDGESRRNSGSIALDWQITPDLLWRVDALLGKHKRTGGYFLYPNSDGAISFIPGKPPAPIDGSRRLAPSWSHYETAQETYGTDLSWDFAADWTLTLAHRYGETGRAYNQTGILADSAGNYSLRYFNYASRTKTAQSQAMINGIFTTGPILHELAVGVSYGKHANIAATAVVNGAIRPIFPFGNIPNVGNLSNPVEVSNPFDRLISYRQTDTETASTRWREVFLSDTLHLSGNWDIILGLRHSNVYDERFFWSKNKYDKSAITPTLAAVFRPLEGLSLYGSYIEALEQGATAPGTAVNAGQIFPPRVSRQVELGAKAEADDWSATAALFRTERALAYTTPANVFTQDGEARYQGLELNGKFRLGSQYLLTASAMWLDATNQKTTGGALDGKRINGVARERFSLYGEYRVPSFPLTLTAGARYRGKLPIHSLYSVGDVTLFDMGARYEAEVAGQSLTLRLNVDNLTDEAYWTTFSGISNLYSGPPRTIKLGVELEW